MRSAFNKDLARSVAHSLGRFLAIAGIVALGTGFYAGLRMTAPDMKLSADLFYDGTSYWTCACFPPWGSPTMIWRRCAPRTASRA